MGNPVDTLLAILDLEKLEENLYRGHSPQSGWQRVFGGQVIGQALVAAQRTVDASRRVHSLHAYFMLPGDPLVPIIYQVDRIRDGGSFTTRRVVAIQHGKAIYSMAASFQISESGFEHFIPMPKVAQPEDLPGWQELSGQYLANAPEVVRRYWRKDRPIELRPVDFTHYVSDLKLDPAQMVWFRATAPLPNDPAIQESVLAYASDMTLLDTSLFAHGRGIFDSDLQVASLDHAIWFHSPFDVSEWHLYLQDSPNASGARGFTRGSIYDRRGRLVASTAQEGLIRQRSGK